jgi:hypothetical protein
MAAAVLGFLDVTVWGPGLLGFSIANEPFEVVGGDGDARMGAGEVVPLESVSAISPCQ